MPGTNIASSVRLLIPFLVRQLHRNRLRAAKKLADVEDELLDIEIKLAKAEEKFAAVQRRRRALI